MVQNQKFNNGPMTKDTRLAGGKGASTICLLAGIWLFISPWVYAAEGNYDAWNSWVIGGFIVLFAALRIARPVYSTVLSYCNAVMAVWTFFSPWIYGYTANTGRFINSLCVGVIVFVFALISASAAHRVNVTAYNQHV